MRHSVEVARINGKTPAAAHHLLLRRCSELPAATLPSRTRERSRRRVERQGELGVFDGTPFLDAEGKPSFLEYARTPGEAIKRGC